MLMSLQIEQKETSAPSVFIPVRKYIPATHNSTENLAPNPKNKKWNRRAGIILDEIFSKCKSGDQKFITKYLRVCHSYKNVLDSEEVSVTVML